jgi:hypothetical protein
VILAPWYSFAVLGGNHPRICSTSAPHICTAHWHRTSVLAMALHGMAAQALPRGLPPPAARSVALVHRARLPVEPSAGTIGMVMPALLRCHDGWIGNR